MLERGGRAALALVLPLVLAACGSSTKGGGGGVAVAEKPKSALETSGIAAFLPRTTPLVVVAANPQRIADDIGWLGLVEAFEELREVRQEALEEVGVDLFAPAGWAKIGVDPTRPAGFAMLDTDLDHGVLAVGLASADAFVAWFKQLAAKERIEHEEKTLGDARLIQADDVVFVMRGDWLFTVLGDSDEGVALYAETIATSVPTASLSSLPAYVAAVDKLSFGSTLATWWDLGTIVKKGADDLAVADEFGAAAMGLELSSSAVETRLVMGLEATGSLRQMWRDHGGVPAIVRTASSAPLFLASLAIDVQGALDLAAKQSGADPAAAKKSVRDALGLDLDRDILPLITGEMGFRLMLDQAKLSQGSPAEAFGGTFLVGLHDGAAAKPRIDQILSNPAFSLRKAPNGKYYQAPPIPGVQVYIGIVGNALVATTNAAAFDAPSAVESFADSVGNAGLSRVLTTEDTAMLMTFDLGQASSAASGFWLNQRDEVEVPDDLPPSGPPEYTRLVGEAAALRDTMKGQQAELADLRARVRDLGGRWGALATTAHMDDFGVRFAGGAYLAPNETLDVLIGDTLRWLKRLDELDREYSRNRSRHWGLLREAREVLDRDDDGESAN